MVNPGKNMPGVFSLLQNLLSVKLVKLSPGRYTHAVNDARECGDNAKDILDLRYEVRLCG